MNQTISFESVLTSASKVKAYLRQEITSPEYCKATLQEEYCAILTVRRGLSPEQASKKRGDITYYEKEFRGEGHRPCIRQGRIGVSPAIAPAIAQTIEEELQARQTYKQAPVAPVSLSDRLTMLLEEEEALKKFSIERKRAQELEASRQAELEYMRAVLDM